MVDTIRTQNVPLKTTAAHLLGLQDEGGGNYSLGRFATGAALANIAGVLYEDNRHVGDANVTIDAADRTISINVTLTATRTHTLPSAADVPAGTQLKIIDETGAISLTNVLIIAPDGTDTINDLTSVCLATPRGGLALISNGVDNWTAWWFAPNGHADARMYGGRGNDEANDTTALNVLVNLQVGQVFIPGGIYRVTALVQTQGNMRVTGTGAGTRIVGTTATADVLQIGSGSADISNVTWEHVSFWTTVNRTGGAMIRATRVRNLKLLDLNVGSFSDFDADGSLLYDGIVIDRFAVVDMKRCHIIGGDRRGLTVYGSSDNLFGVGLFTDAYCFISSWGSHGIYISGGTGGVNLNLNVQQCSEDALRVDSTLGSTYNRELFLGPDIALDSCTGAGAHFGTNSSFQVLGNCPWIAGNDSHGIYIAPTQISTSGGATFKFTGANIYSNIGNGIYDEGAGSNLIVTGSHIFLNGSVAAGGGSAHGIWCKDKGDGSFTVVGNQISENGQSGAGFGIEISGTNNYFTISANDVTGNAQGSIDNQSGFSANKKVTGNIGYTPGGTYTPTVAAGSGTITTSSASGTYRIEEDRIHFDVQVTITTNGTGGTYVSFTLPNTVATPAAYAGREIAATGNSLNAYSAAAGNVVQVQKYDGTYPAANGYVLSVSGSYLF